jgi:anaerobic glycerol-3-phosphate dehydrogenase
VTVTDSVAAARGPFIEGDACGAVLGGFDALNAFCGGVPSAALRLVSPMADAALVVS